MIKGYVSILVPDLQTCQLRNNMPTNAKMNYILSGFMNEAKSKGQISMSKYRFDYPLAPCG
jgi:hypothetical protein